MNKNLEKEIREFQRLTNALETASRRLENALEILIRRFFPLADFKIEGSVGSDNILEYSIMFYDFHGCPPKLSEITKFQEEMGADDITIDTDYKTFLCLVVKLPDFPTLEIEQISE